MRGKRQSRIEPGQGEMRRLEFLCADHSIEGSLVFKSIPCTFVVLWATRKVEGQNKKHSRNHFLTTAKKLKFISLPRVKLRLALVDGRFVRPREPGVTHSFEGTWAPMAAFCVPTYSRGSVLPQAHKGTQNDYLPRRNIT